MPVDQYPPPLGPIDTSALSTHHEQNLLPTSHSLAGGKATQGTGTADGGDAARDVRERRKSLLLSTQEREGSHCGVSGGGSISLAVGNSDSSQLSLVNGKGSEATTPPSDNAGGAEVTGDSCAAKAQTGDSNGCDFTSDSHDYDRVSGRFRTAHLCGVVLIEDAFY